MIRLGMIGCGQMAGAFLHGLRELEPRLQITAAVDIKLERAERAAGAIPGARAFTDYREALDLVDAVIIALPHDLHHAVGLDCLAAGKHVLMEKPLANTEAQCLDLIRAAEASGRVLSVGYVMRHDALCTELGRLIREETFGTVFQVSIWTEQLTDLRRGAWLGQRLRVGGGQLFSHGCHYIDLLLHWLGRPVHGTHTGTNLGTPWMEMEGTSNVAIRFAGGALGYHFGTWGARGTRLGYAMHAHCTEGMLEMNRREGTIILHRDLTGGDLPALQAALAAGAQVDSPSRTILYQRQPTGKATNAEVTELLDCIETGREPIANPRVALQSLRVIWKLYDAEERGAVADLRGLGLDEYVDAPILGDAGQAVAESRL
jgi:predicted dehydrogenase